MGAVPPTSLNFGFLAVHHQRLVLLGAQAEQVFHSDPLATLMRLRQLTENLALGASAHAGLLVDTREDQVSRLRRLQDARVMNRDVAEIFHSVRKAGNAAVHDGVGDAGTALHHLKLARSLAVWFHKSFGNDPKFAPGPFVPPRPPEDATQSLRDQIDQLRTQLTSTAAAEEAARQIAEEARRAALSAAQRSAEDPMIAGSRSMRSRRKWMRRSCPSYHEAGVGRQATSSQLSSPAGRARGRSSTGAARERL